MSNNDGDGVEVDRLPPSPVKRHIFGDGRIEVLARFALWIPGQVDRVYTFGAEEVHVGEFELLPPGTYDDDEFGSEIHAFYAGDEEETIVYYLETWGDDAVIGFAECHLIWELHELTHWAAPVEDNEQDEGHSERWNRTLTRVVEYVMDVDEWDIREYEPPTITEPTNEADTTTQSTFPEVLKNAN